MNTATSWLCRGPLARVLASRPLSSGPQVSYGMKQMRVMDEVNMRGVGFVRGFAASSAAASSAAASSAASVAQAARVEDDEEESVGGVPKEELREFQIYRWNPEEQGNKPSMASYTIDVNKYVFVFLSVFFFFFSLPKLLLLVVCICTHHHHLHLVCWYLLHTPLSLSLSLSLSPLCMRVSVCLCSHGRGCPLLGFRLLSCSSCTYMYLCSYIYIYIGTKKRRKAGGGLSAEYVKEEPD